MIEVDRPADVAPLIAARAPGALPLVPRGLGSRLGTELVDGELLSLARLRAIEELDAGEMVLTALAGTPVDVAARAAEAEGLLLCPLLPPGSRGTLGGLHANGDESPAAPAEGRIRDAVLGLEGVVGSGEALRGGGRVVKNVTGYDLVRFLSGSRGSLAVITRLHWRLRRRPECFLEVAADCPASELEARLGALRRGADPTALRIELAGGVTRVRALIEGSASVAAERASRIAMALRSRNGPEAVPAEELAGWLEPGDGSPLRGGAREVVAAVARLAADPGARAVAFPFAGFARVARGASAEDPSGNREAAATADPFFAAARAAWDPSDRLWRGGERNAVGPISEAALP